MGEGGAWGSLRARVVGLLTRGIKSCFPPQLDDYGKYILILKAFQRTTSTNYRSSLILVNKYRHILIKPFHEQLLPTFYAISLNEQLLLSAGIKPLSILDQSLV